MIKPMSLKLSLIAFVSILFVCSCYAHEQRKPFDEFMGYAIEGVYPIFEIADKSKFFNIEVRSFSQYSEFSKCTLHLNPVNKQIVGVSTVSDKMLDTEVARKLILRVMDGFTKTYGKSFSVSADGLQGDCWYFRQMKQYRGLRPTDRLNDLVHVRISCMGTMSDPLTHVMMSAWSETLEELCKKDISAHLENRVTAVSGRCSGIRCDGQIEIETIQGRRLVVKLARIQYPAELLWPSDFAKAKARLSELLLNQAVYLEYICRGKENVGIVWVNSWLEVNLDLLSRGLVYRDVSAEVDIAAAYAEDMAKSLSLGVWKERMSEEQ